MDIKKIPVIGDIDFSDPAKRKNSILICVAGIMVVLVLIAMVVSKSREAKADSQMEAESQEQYTPLEIPMGQSNEDIGGRTMVDISRRRGTEGNFAKDLFSDDIAADDPLAVLNGEKGARAEGPAHDDPLADAERESTPEFMKRHQKKSGHDVYPEETVRERKPNKTTKRPGEAAARATGSVKDEEKAMSEMSYEERRRYMYKKNGLDPDTGEPIPGGRFDPAAYTPSKKEESNAPAPAEEQEKTTVAEPAKVQVRRSGGVSSFGLSGASGGASLSSLGEADEFVTDDPTHPFKVKFAYNEKVSSGQRVTIRLCEDMVVNGVLIPENTHLFATCSISDRLQLKVNSININGKIYSLNYVAYDNDGAEGLYCPQTDASKAAQQAGEAAGQIAQQAVSSALSGYPGRIFNAGTQIVNSKKGKQTVYVTAGYSFYLMQAN